MISKKIILTSILFYSCVSFSGEPGSASLNKQLEFDINSMKIGDKLTEEFFNKYCPPLSKDNAEIECKQNFKLNEIKLSIRYFFYNAKLITISFVYPSSKYNDLIKTYTEKFSESPHNTKEESVLLSTGVEYTNQKASWNTISGEFVIEKYWNNFKKGYAHLLSTEYEKYKIKKSEGNNNEGIFKKIFGDILD